MKLKLRAIKHGNDRNQFCGPAVISAVTNLTTGEAARLIRKQTKRRSVTGTSQFEVTNALIECGISSRTYFTRDEEGNRVPLGSRKGPTLARWLKLSKCDRTSDRVFLIIAGNHWQLVSGRRYTCGRVRGIVSVRDKRIKRRARVSLVYELTAKSVTKPTIDVSKPKDTQASTRSSAHRLAKKLNISLEVERHSEGTDIYINQPDWVTDEEDPLLEYQGHTAFNWEEALDFLGCYEELLAEREKAAARTATSS
tara:strand:- start:181 stop:939 length:759 start_codon:yes stop_codon:yes gene_type:complete